MSRARKKNRHRHPPGTPPGTIAIDPQSPRPQLRVMAYGPSGFVERDITDLAELANLRAASAVLWLDVQGLGDAAIVEALGSVFGLHRLALEDVVNVHQRSKVEVYEGNVFVVVRQPEAERPLVTEQVSLFLGSDFVLSFQDRPGDCFDPVRARLRREGPIRSRGADYLLYALVDATVDSWFPVLERYGEALETAEDTILGSPRQRVIGEVHELRRDFLALRRAVWPLRDALGVLYRDSTPLISADTRVYLRDCYDHSVQIIDLLENSRELSAELTDLYLSMVSYRMNAVMKVLTIISTIFLPLSFIAGVYGMNFDTSISRWNMPELGWPFGYPLVLGLMAGIAVGFLLYFRRKGWLG